MSSVPPDERAKEPTTRKLRRVTVSLIVLLVLFSSTVFYLMKRTTPGFQVRWHFRELHFGRFNTRRLTFTTDDCYSAVARGYRLGWCDVFRVTREPAPPGIQNARLLIKEKSAMAIVDGDSGADIWREVQKGLGHDDPISQAFSTVQMLRPITNGVPFR